MIKTLINEMESSEVGLLRKLKAEGLSEDMTVRLLSDLMMAAIDTVGIFNHFYCPSINFLKFSLQNQFCGIFTFWLKKNNYKKGFAVQLMTNQMIMRVR